MIRHYCDVCKKEVAGHDVNIMTLEVKDNIFLGRELVVEGYMNNELCGDCAKRIALYVITKCKEEEHE